MFTFHTPQVAAASLSQSQFNDKSAGEGFNNHCDLQNQYWKVHVVWGFKGNGVLWVM